MNSLEVYDTFEPYSAERESGFASVKPASVQAAKTAIERFRARHGKLRRSSDRTGDEQSANQPNPGSIN